MKKESYIKQCIEIINKYKLKRNDKAKLVEQVMDVIDEVEQDDLFTLGTPQEFVDEVLALNDINPELQGLRSRRTITGGRIVIGLVIVLIGLSFVIPSITWVIIWAFMFTGFAVWSIFRRAYIATLFWLIVAFLTVNAFYELVTIQFLPLIIAFMLVAIGLRITFSRGHNKRGRRETINYNNYYNYDFNTKEDLKKAKREIKEEQKQQRENMRKSMHPDSETKEKEVLYIDNTFSGSDIRFTNEEINYISVRNKFGGGTLDFTDYDYPLGDVTIDVRNLFGGCDVTVGRDVEVIGSSKSFLGGSSYPTNNLSEVNHKIYILSRNTFGGMSVERNKEIYAK